MSLLEVRNISKKYNSQIALNNVSFSLDSHETMCIIGNSGSGKTTILRLLNSLETYDSGSIVIDGEELTTNSKGSVPFGLVFQGFSLFPQYNSFENIMLGLKNKIKNDLKKETSSLSIFKRRKYLKKRYMEELSEKKELVISLFNRFGLKEKLNSYPMSLSGGEAQRVAIIRALVLNPKILCFDEPTSALDPKLKKEVAKVINELKELDVTMLVVTHEMEFAANVADKVIYMENGNIIEYGSKDILLNPKTIELNQFLSKEE